MRAKATSERKPQAPKRRRAPRQEWQAQAGDAPLTQDHQLLREHSLIGVYWTTLDGQILDCNESMARMLGYASRQALIKRRAADLYPTPGDRRSFLARLRRAGTLTNSELCLRRKDGSVMYVLENVVLVRGAAGRPATIQGAMVDITDRKLAEQALRESEHRYRIAASELRRLTQHVEKLRETTRARIARELHDELGQALTVLNMDLHGLQEQAARNQPIPVARVAAMGKLAGQTIHALRRICTDLRPALLDDLGLSAAIEWQAREFQTRTGVPCAISVPHAPLVLPGDQATSVFRILQESLTNIARHAHATRASITLRVRSKTLTLKIADNGVGIAQARSAGGQSLGLMGMRERAVQWQGHLDITGVPGRGTTVTLCMPLGPRGVEAAP